MIKGRTKYWDLGRGKAKGEIEINCATPEEFNYLMRKEFSRHLMSSEISFEDGKIYAGFRSVGNYEFIAVEDRRGGKSNGV